MHTFDAETDQLADAILSYSRRRMSMDPVPLHGTRTSAELADSVGQTVGPEGMGGKRALQLFEEILAKACISVDHPRNLSFIPAAPTPAAVLFDLALGASSVYGGSWLEGAGAVYAENQALRWLADLAGFPPAAGGVFVQGGTLGNLSALVTARATAEARLSERGVARPERWRVVCGADTHPSVAQAAAVMDAEVITVPPDAEGRLTGVALARLLADRGVDDVCAVVATAGTTQFGAIDDLTGIACAAHAHSIWLHVDGAYGLAALAAPSARELFDGISAADSFIVDPHKWLFAPFDACALVYRDPALAKAAHTQQAGYLEVLSTPDGWNPSDYAVHLSRRARGMPFWFSLATHGTRAYGEAIEKTLAVAQSAAAVIRACAYLELIREPRLSIVVFRRLGWQAHDYHAWSERLLKENIAFVPPTVHDGETVARFAVVSPRTTDHDIAAILATMA